MFTNKGMNTKTAIIFIISYVIVYYGILYSPLNLGIVYILTAILSLIAPIIAIYIMWSNVKDINGKRKKFWVILSIGCLNYTIAVFCWRWEIYPECVYKYPGIADIFWVLNLFIFSFSLLYRFYTEKEKYRILKTWFDVLILITVLYTFYWIHIIDPIILESKLKGISLFFTSSYIVGYLMVLLSSILIFISYQQKFTILQSYTYLMGIIIYAMCDAYYLYQVNTTQSYFNILIEPIASISLLIISLSSYFEGKTEKENIQCQSLNKRSFAFKRMAVTCLSVFLLLFTSLKSEYKVTIFISLMLVFCFIFIRQILTLLDNNKILTEIETLNQSLEKKVFLRTLELEEKNKQLHDLNESLEDIVNHRTKELVHAQNQLSESKQLYQSLFKHHPDLIVTYNLTGDVIRYNKKIDNQTIRFLKEMIYDIGIGYFDRALSDETENVERSYLNERGEWVHFHVTLIPMRINNELKGAFGIFHDITDQRKAEELLKKSEMITAMGYLAAGVAHEVRNPLTSIKGFLQLMNWDDTNPTYKEIIFNELNQVEFVINEYLALSKPKEKVFEFVDIHQLIMKISRVMKTQSILKGITIEVKSEGKLPLVYCVEKELSQVFVNITKNAIEASYINSKIEIFLSSLSDHNLQILIKDNGVGIPPERLKRLGEPYYSNKEKGTGLGLMNCFKIIQEHRGFIQFNSEEGKGTSVSITLPVTPR